MNITETYLKQLVDESTYIYTEGVYMITLENAREILEQFEIDLRKEYENDKGTQEVDGYRYYWV